MTAKTESDYDTSNWRDLLFVSVAAFMYLVIVAEISIVQTYLQLCEEDYLW